MINNQYPFNFPKYVWFEIFEYSTQDDLKNLFLTCKDFAASEGVLEKYGKTSAFQRR